MGHPTPYPKLQALPPEVLPLIIQAFWLIMPCLFLALLAIAPGSALSAFLSPPSSPHTDQCPVYSGFYLWLCSIFIYNKFSSPPCLGEVIFFPSLFFDSEIQALSREGGFRERVKKVNVLGKTNFSSGYYLKERQKGNKKRLCL